MVCYKLSERPASCTGCIGQCHARIHLTSRLQGAIEHTLSTGSGRLEESVGIPEADIDLWQEVLSNQVLDEQAQGLVGTIPGLVIQAKYVLDALIDGLQH